jgi:glycosyltransferase involved in cell wall biosynthesis
MPKPSTFKRALFLQATDASAYPPTLNMQALMIERGWHVACLNSPMKDSLLKMPVHERLQTITLPARDSFVMPKKHYLRYVWESASLLRSFAPGVVIYADPNATPLGIFPTRAIRVYQEHDTPKKLPGLVANARKRLLSKADFILFPNAKRAQMVQQLVGLDQRKLRIIWNLPMRSEVAAQVRKTGEVLTLYYHGSINAERLPISVVSAVKSFNGRIRLLIAGYEVGAKSYVASLEARAPGLVRYLGEFATRKELFAQMDQADVGLALMPMESIDINMQHMTGASNKAFDYMAGGLGLLVSALPDWQDMFAKPGYGDVCNPNDEASVRRALELFLDQPERLQAMRMRNRDKAHADWHFERQGTDFVRELENALANKESS